ncbi:hypothetical protein KD050_12905 [Psychrobacillus sp. INOP01]|uniref:hypothetical protein n=1 Tax=Psychrobacillus sp. INOP01 TaxID=2829187 RepID=UPI001BADFE5E|nr:hypothetical protein [Psychrobacillus sp. INOP01]QUG40204.1 hypothetical protein KD050_12905 [Psychrobacillus sp. INOP01]
MNFIKQPNTPISRTLYETDRFLFQKLLNDETPQKNDWIDNRQVVMVAIGILNRTLDLDTFLVAVVGQKWRFNRHVKIGESLSVAYQILDNKSFSNKRFLYDIKMELFVGEEVIAAGIWEIMLNSKL